MEKLKSIAQSATRTKKRFFGIVFVAVILIVALGAGYYFRYKSNQTFYKKYGLEILDSYYYRIGRELNTEILKITSKIESPATKSSDTLASRDSIDAITSAAINSLLESIELENGYLEKPFSEFIISIIPKGKDSSSVNSIRTKNSLFIEANLKYDSLLAKDSLNNGLVRNYQASGTNYLLFGRKYQFRYAADNDYACEIVLIGLVDGTIYNKATRELDPWVIVMLLTFLLISLFGLPFFKMIFIASDERVFSRDIITAGFAMVVGSSLVLVIFMSLMEYAHKYNVELPDNLEQMGDSISHRFIRENKANVKALYDFDIEKYNDTVFDEIKVEDSDMLQHFKFILTIDDSSDIWQKINLIKRPPPGSFPKNIKDREYVSHFKEKINIWRGTAGVNQNKDSNRIPYVMRPVVAMESGEEEAVYLLEDINSGHDTISETGPHESCRYRVASAQLSSIHLPIMPFGFQYAIIDDTKNSDVWFHSQPGKSTLEEFFKVSRNANDLRAAIYSRVEAEGRLNYHGSKYLYFITPIQGTNLNVVVLYDLSLLRLQTSEVISITGIAISVSFIAIGFVFLLTLLLKGRKTKLYKEEKFIFDFLTPKSRYGNRYLYLTICFAIILVLGAGFGLTLQFPPVSAFTIGFLDILWSFILVYYVLYPYDRTDYRFFLNNLLFISAIVALNGILWFKGTGEPLKFASALYLQAIFLIMIMLAQLGINNNQRKASDRLTNDSAFSEESNSLNYIGKVGSWLDNFPLSLPHRYSIFLFSWLIAAVLLPALVFYEKAENINELIWVKTNQIHMSKSFLGKERKLRKILPPIRPNDMSLDYVSVYKKHLENAKYIDKTYSLNSRKILSKKDNEPRENGVFRKLLWSTRPIYDEKIRNYKGMVYESAADSSWSSIEHDEQIELATLNNTTKADEIFSVWAGIGNTPKSREDIHYYLWWLRVLGIIASLGIIYSITHFYTNRFYGFRFSGLKPIKFDSDKKFESEFGRILSCEDSNSGLLLIGLPFSGKKNFAERIILACDEILVMDNKPKSPKASDVLKRTAHLSFLKLDSLQKGETIEMVLNSIAGKNLFKKTENSWDCRIWKSTTYFIVENLEHGLKSFDLNRVKLKVISYLVAHKKRVVLTSEVYPNQLFSIYKPFLESEGDLTENELLGDYNSWRNIFGAFPQVLVGMTDQRKQVYDALAELNNQKESVDEIADEVGFSQFLPRLAPIMISKYDEGEFDRQSMILHVQKLSHGYYTDIWNGLPSRERYMLYDLAKDGFMNIKNGNSLFSLMKKGLVVWRDRPHLFNESFQNFIVSFVSKKEALQLETRNRKESSWGTIKIVMYLMILTLIVFILLGEPGLLDDFEELLAAVGGLGVIIPIISTILGKSGEK